MVDKGSGYSTCADTPFTMAYSQGAPLTMNYYFRKAAVNSWDVYATVNGQPFDGPSPATGKVSTLTFDSTGGRSWRDRYVVWVDAERATVDAFAYDYEDGDGETRLRLVTRAWTVGGVRFQNYATFTDDAMKGHIERYLGRIGTPTLRPVSDVDLDGVADLLLPAASGILYVFLSGLDDGAHDVSEADLVVGGGVAAATGDGALLIGAPEDNGTGAMFEVASVPGTWSLPLDGTRVWSGTIDGARFGAVSSDPGALIGPFDIAVGSPSAAGRADIFSRRSN